MQHEIFEEEFKALGTQIHIWVSFDVGEKNKFEKDIEDLKKLYAEKEKIFSRFDPESELNYFNRNLNKFIPASNDFLYLCQKALEYHDFSQGLFDPRIIEILESIGYDRDFKKIYPVGAVHELPARRSVSLNEDLKIKKVQVLFKKRMDFSGLAKGYITDEGVKFLKNKNWKNFILDSGGDMFASGLNNSKKWEIELEGILPDKLKLKLQGVAVATSGITRRKWEAGNKKFHHLINPEKPADFSFELKSATVLRETTEEADVYAKILFLMRKDAGIKFADDLDIAVIFLDYRGNIFISNLAKKYLI